MDKEVGYKDQNRVIVEDHLAGDSRKVLNNNIKKKILPQSTGCRQIILKLPA